MLSGDAAGAMPSIERGLASARARGDRLATYIALYNLSQAAVAQGDLATARRHLEEGIRLSLETGDLANLAYFLDMLAVVEGSRDEPHRVAVLLGAAQALRETVGANVYGYYQPDEALREQRGAARLRSSSARTTTATRSTSAARWSLPRRSPTPLTGARERAAVLACWA